MKITITKKDVTVTIDVTVEEIVKLVSVLDDNVDREDNKVVEQYDYTEVDGNATVVETYKGYHLWKTDYNWIRWFKNNSWEDRSPLLDDVEQAKYSVDLYLANK